MKISLNWLNEYVDVQDYFSKPEELAKLLTGAGLEVEAIEHPGKKWAHVVVGQIKNLAVHPNADKLTLCQVDIGSGTLRQIVCGAKNHKSGDHVVVALPGAILPGNFAIKISKIRDVESQGMLCSESELGIKEKSEGILILPKDAPVGKSFAEFSGANDIIFELNVTPNRADCLSHVGLAQELTCLLERKLKLPVVQSQASNQKTADCVSVEVRNADLCPRYAGQAIFGVKVGPSPQWLRARLEAIGVNSINNIVDVTNFVMMEYGQPLHAFDVAEIRGKKIIVAKSQSGEKFKTFDGSELQLFGDELTIRDQDRVVALAGVIGGQNSGVSEKTKDVFLEVAHFNPKAVRRSARRHGIETDSSQRFSRGTDPLHVIEVMKRATALIAEVSGGVAAQEAIDIYSQKYESQVVRVRHAILEGRLGYKVTLEQFALAMKRLFCLVKVEGESALVTPPAFRFDLNIEMDFVEEYARLNGYDKIPEAFPHLETNPTAMAVQFVNENRLAEFFRREGFFEARNYNFLNPKWQSALVDEKIFSALGLGPGGVAVRVQNPLSEETAQMRQSLLPGLLTNLNHNYHYGEKCGRLFETGFVFGQKNTGCYVEGHRLAAVVWGHEGGLWGGQQTPTVLQIKGAIERLQYFLNAVLQFKNLEISQVPGFIHAGQVSGLFFEGKSVGFFGSVHPQYRDTHKIREEIAVLEVDLTALMRGQPRLHKLRKFSRFQAIERDLAFVLPTSITVAEVLKEISKVGGAILQGAYVFDVFTGKGVPEGHKSVAFKMVFQDMESTLTDEQINPILEQIKQTLVKKNISVRA